MRIHRVSRSLIRLSLLSVLATGCGSAPYQTPTATVYPITTAALSSGGASAVLFAQSNPASVNNSVTGVPLTVSSYLPTASGSPTPSFNLTVPQGNFLYSIATDKTGQIYASASDSLPAAVQVFAANANGNSAPTRTIVGGQGSFASAQFLGVDAAGQLYVYDCCTFNPATNMYVNGADAIFVLPAVGSGAVTPVRILSGALTGLQNTTTNQVQAMAVDPSGTIYVGVSNIASPISTINILAFDPSQSGNVAPARRITGVLKSAGQTPPNIYMTALSGMATDASGNLYAALNTDTNPYKTSIVEFASGANGIATPVKMIGGTATGLGLLSSIAVDGPGNVYVSSVDQTSNLQMSVRSFGATGSENLTPASVFLVQIQGLVSHIGQLAVK